MALGMEVGLGLDHIVLDGQSPTSIPSSILIPAAIWPQQIWAKIWGSAPRWGRGAGSPSNSDILVTITKTITKMIAFS